MDAGFIGCWGEWHTSSNNLIGTDSNDQAVMNNNSRLIADKIFEFRSRKNGAISRLELRDDPRSWQPGTIHTVNVRSLLPAKLATGEYDLLLGGAFITYIYSAN